jgi:hypothetical protein
VVCLADPGRMGSRNYCSFIGNIIPCVQYSKQWQHILLGIPFYSSIAVDAVNLVAVEYHKYFAATATATKLIFYKLVTAPNLKHLSGGCMGEGRAGLGRGRRRSGVGVPLDLDTAARSFFLHHAARSV